MGTETDNARPGMHTQVSKQKSDDIRGYSSDSSRKDTITSPPVSGGWPETVGASSTVAPPHTITSPDAMSQSGVVVTNTNDIGQQGTGEGYGVCFEVSYP